MEIFCKDLFDEAVEPFDIVQASQSLSAILGTIPVLHFRLEPTAQGKLVRCIAGTLRDVAFAIRRHRSGGSSWRRLPWRTRTGGSRSSPTWALHSSIEIFTIKTSIKG